MGILENDPSFGALLSLLLSVIAYFLKFLHQDFRMLQQDFQEIKTTKAILEGKISGISRVLHLQKRQLARRGIPT